MFKTLAIASLIIAAPIAVNAAPIDQATRLLYAANNTVQRAVDRDACLHWDMLKENRTARHRLSAKNAAAYHAIASALGNAYAASAGTDAALEAVKDSFCEAVSNR